MGRFRRGRGVSGYHLAPCTALCGRLSCVVSSGPGPMCCLTLQNRPIRWAWLSIPHASRSGLGRHHRRRLPPRRSRGCGGRSDVSRSLPEALVFLVPTTMWRCIRIADPGHFACQFTTVAANSSCRARSGLRDPAEDLHQDRYVRRHYGPLGELWQERRHRCSAAYRSARTNGCRAAWRPACATYPLPHNRPSQRMLRPVRAELPVPGYPQYPQDRKPPSPDTPSPLYRHLL